MHTCCRDNVRFDSEFLITDGVINRSSDPGCQLALLFRSVQTCFWLSLEIFEIYIKTMANQVPANQLTVAQAHQEFTKLVDQISAKFVQLDSGEFGAVGTPAFDAKMHELAVLFARMSQLCSRLGLPIPAHLHRPPFFKH